MTDDCRHPDVSKGPRGMVKLQTPVAMVPVMKIPVNLLINNHCFWTYLPYLLGEVLSSRELVSVICRLQVRFL